MTNKVKMKDFILLHMVFLVVALGGVASKMAAMYPAFSFPFLAYYALYLGTLGVYAIAWVQVLKRVPLITAFCNKAITIVWSMLFGWLVFNETITLKSVFSAGVVILGVILVVTADE